MDGKPRESGTRGRWSDTCAPRPSQHLSSQRCGFPQTEGRRQGIVHPTLTTWTIMRCTCYGVWLYFRVCLRYRDVEALRAERDASTSLPMRATT